MGMGREREAGTANEPVPSVNPDSASRDAANSTAAVGRLAATARRRRAGCHSLVASESGGSRGDGRASAN